MMKRPTSSIAMTTERPSEAASASRNPSGPCIGATLAEQPRVCRESGRARAGVVRAAEARRRARPGLAVAAEPVPALLRAERDQLRELLHRLGVAERREMDEPLRVERIAEQ